MKDNRKIDQNNMEMWEWINKISFVFHQNGFSPSEMLNPLIALLLIRRIDCVMQPWCKQIRSEYSHSSNNADEYMMVKEICGLNHFNYSGYSLSELDFLDFNNNVEDQFDFYVNSFDRETRDILNTLNFNATVMRIRPKIRLVLSLLVKLDLTNPMSVEVFHIISRYGMPYNFTSNELYDIMSYYLFDKCREKDNAVIFDPWCSFGDRLVYAKDYAEKKGIKVRYIFGTDPSSISANWGKAFSIICGMEDTVIKMHESYIRPFHNHANYIISVPPFGMKLDSHSISEMEKSHMYPIGVTSTCRAELLFMQMALYYLNNDGKAAIVVPDAVSFSSTPKDKDIRSWLINNDYLDSIISIPKLDSLKNISGVNLSLWILDKDKPLGKKGKITFVDLRNIVSTIKEKNPHNVLWMDYILEHCEKDAFEKYTVTVPIQDISVYKVKLKNHRSGKIAEVNVPFKESSDLPGYLMKIGYSTRDLASSSWEILYDSASKEYNLDFSSFLVQEKAKRENPFDIIKDIKEQYSKIPHFIADILSLEEPSRRTGGHDIGSWAEFVPNHWLPTTIEQVANCCVANKPTVNEGGNLPICDVKYLRGNVEDVQYASSDDKNTFVQKGDFVLIRSGANSGEVFEIREKGVLGASLMLIRPNSEKVLPEFLGYFLKAMSPYLKESADRGIAMKSLSLRDVASSGCYYPDIEEQHRIVEYLDGICGNIDSISETLGVKVPKLELLRESIIFEAITGKIRI